MRWILLILVLLCVATVYADSLEVTYDTVRADLLPGEDATFNLHIKNFGDERYVEVKSVDLNWIMKEDGASFVVPKEGTVDFEVNYGPLSEYEPGRYGLNLLIVSDKDRVEQFLPVTVLGYDQIIDVTFISAPVIDPRKETLVKLNLDNKYDLDLGLLDVELSGPGFSQAKKVVLGPETSELLKFELDLNENLMDGEQAFHVKIFNAGHVYMDKDLVANIEKYSDFKEVVTSDESFLYKALIVSHVNEGNTHEEEVYTKKLSLLERWLTRYNPKPDSFDKKDGVYYANWNVVLNPNESSEIRVVTNYRWPVGIIIVVILVVLGVWYFRKRSVAVKRKIVTVKKGETKVSAHVTIAVRSDANIQEVRVMERVPHVTGALKDFSVKPTKTKKEAGMLVMYWDFKKLLKKDEVNLSYTVLCNVAAKDLEIPPTVVRYSEKGNRFMALSKKVDF